METIKGSAFVEPFPHLIFKNFYNQEELDLIWEELNFLCYPTKLRRATAQSGGAQTPEGTLLKLNYHSYLDGLYAFRDMSNILMVNRKLFGNGYEIFRQHDSWFFKNLHINKDNTQVGYYEENDEYKTHIDSSTVTSLTWLYKEPKRFTGGDLIFPDFDNYTVSTFAGQVGSAGSSDGTTSSYQQPLILTDDSGNPLTDITNVTWENAQVMGSGVNGETTRLLSSYYETSDQNNNSTEILSSEEVNVGFEGERIDSSYDEKNGNLFAWAAATHSASPPNI